MNILISGGSGYLASKIAHKAIEEGYSVTLITRKFINVDKRIACIDVGDYFEYQRYDAILKNVDVFIHCAAIAHDANNKNNYKESDILDVNARLPIFLAKKCILSGVGKFIMISSIAVNGVRTNPGEAFTELSKPCPDSVYARGKYQAEVDLEQISRKSSLKVSIIRPPMIYGKGAPGNYGALCKLIKLRLPLPFKGLTNKRSFIHVDRCVQVILNCCNNQATDNNTYLIADEKLLTVSEFILNVEQFLNGYSLQFYLPKKILRLILSLMNKQSISNKLLDDFIVDDSKAIGLNLYSLSKVIKLGHH